jgi:hypothetical protein
MRPALTVIVIMVDIELGKAILPIKSLLSATRIHMHGPWFAFVRSLRASLTAF